MMYGRKQEEKAQKHEKVNQQFIVITITLIETARYAVSSTDYKKMKQSEILTKRRRIKSLMEDQLWVRLSMTIVNLTSLELKMYIS